MSTSIFSTSRESHQPINETSSDSMHNRNSDAVLRCARCAFVSLTSLAVIGSVIYFSATPVVIVTLASVLFALACLVAAYWSTLRNHFSEEITDLNRTAQESKTSEEVTSNAEIDQRLYQDVTDLTAQKSSVIEFNNSSEIRIEETDSSRSQPSLHFPERDQTTSQIPEKDIEANPKQATQSAEVVGLDQGTKRVSPASGVPAVFKRQL